MKCKVIIPEELLRRSTRVQSSMTTKKQTKLSIDEVSRHSKSVKKIKIEPSAVCKTLDRRLNISSVLPTSSESESDYLKPPQAEDHLEVGELELDLERTLMGGQSFRWTKNDCYRPVLFTGIIGDNVLQLWRSSPSRVSIRRLNKESRKRNIGQTRNLLKDYFRLEYKLEDLYAEWSSKDPHLAKCCSQYTGFRILRQDPVENLFSFICATNNNIKRISQMVEHLCQRFGNILESFDDESIYESYQTFPSVDRLAQDDVQDCLRNELKFGYRAKFIAGTAQKLSSLATDANMLERDFLLKLRTMPYKETCKILQQFPGIGRKVADCICLMSMDHLCSVPIDCHIYEIVCRQYMKNLRQERKTLTESVHDMIGDYFVGLHGELAGWSTSVLFISELPHLSATKVKPKKEASLPKRNVNKT